MQNSDSPTIKNEAESTWIPRAEQPARHWSRIGLWSVKLVLAAAFIAAGSANLYGLPILVQNFEQIGLGQWFRYFTGTLELIGAAALLVPAVAPLGALLLAAIMVGATLTHLFVLPGSPVPAVVLFALSVMVAWAHRDQIAALTNKILVDRD
jgi:putative oxidoreductase